MTAISRRRLLVGGAAAAGLSVAVGGTASALAGSRSTPAARVALTRSEHRVVVVGSGFGGGVTALRLAQAGVPVTVLERGKRWPTGPDADTFPRPTTSPDSRLFWLGSAADPLDRMVNPLGALLGRVTAPGAAVLPLPSLGTHTGLLERVGGRGMEILCAAGVGGGSLAYQGMTLQPSAELFEETMPAGLDYARMDRVHYPRVASMLRVATAPDELINARNYTASRIFADHVRRAGDTVEKIPMPIDWRFAQRELAGEMRPSYTNGDCAMGVNNRGKHSVDVTYLAAAEATGRVTVAPLHHVTDVVRARDGRWEIHVDRIDTTGAVQEKKILTAKALVMAAGTANTTKLLMRAQAHGTVPDLPDGLGENWGTNGDVISTWTNLAEDFGAPQGGPVVYGSKDWADPATANTIIQASLPPLPNLRTTMIVGFGVSPGRGRFRWDAARDEAVLHWPGDGDAAIERAIKARMGRITGLGSLLLHTTDVVPATWHPLGGACIGTVCDRDGRVEGQRGLYVLDGALIPGSTAACNPSMTIAAVAERATDGIVARDVDTVF